MNKQELENKIEELEKELAKVKLELQKKDQEKIWKPGLFEDYYCIDKYGEVNVDSNEGHNLDDKIFNFGNYFKTREEAEKQANYQKYTNLLRKYVEEHSEPLDWENPMQAKYEMYYSFNDKVIRFYGLDAAKSQGVIYASSEEVLRDAIEFVGEENIKKYIFGVED